MNGKLSAATSIRIPEHMKKKDKSTVTTVATPKHSRLFCAFCPNNYNLFTGESLDCEETCLESGNIR